MAKDSSVFVGIDAAKLKHAVAVAEPGRLGEVRYIGEVEASPEAMRRLLTRLAARHGNLHVCYEAGPTGYGRYRQVVALGHACTVVAPSLIPRKSGDRVKTNRRDAVALARLLRAGELTAVWVPDEAHEAMRDLVRAREAAVDDLRRKRQAISSMLLKHGRAFSGKTTWGARHQRWLAEQAFEHPAQQVVLQELILAARHAKERLERVEVAIVEFLPQWSLAPLVEALQALRGIRLPTAATIVAEIGDLGRFDTARQFMGYLGLVPGERSTGETVRRLGITKAGNGRIRRALIESAWTYRHPARVGKDKLYVHRRVPPVVRDIAHKAQARLCARYRSLSARGKKLTVAVTAVARELAAFIWAIGKEVKPA
ncbi:Transposase (plasmid) [Roseomonas mucosa]|uniref:IS110 family transposase n=1 Tax=Roseomonas mucosa TaxID=207340 RepID=UPI00220EC52D|nr:IS110 family transposase [Roseomonas mucosa]QDJ11616.1 Transposase [Roseomonas mucosa]